jgi:N-acetylglucosaminyldiphosphoundecaprenol N-acetyl-beta-D-mannosaminyltransferase
MNLLDSKISCRCLMTELLSNGLETKEAITVTFVNPFSYYILKSRDYLLKSLDYVFIDGLLLQRLHNIFHKNKVRRASFDLSSIADDVFKYCCQKKLKVSLIGAQKFEIDKAVKNIKSIYPELIICSYRNGYFSGTELIDYLRDIKNLNPDVIIVGAGTPVQEEIICKLKKMNIGRLLFTCGGFFTQTSIKKDYYHPIIKRLDLRWLQRAFLHKHVRKRLFCNYPHFVIKYLFEKIYSERVY